MDAYPIGLHRPVGAFCRLGEQLVGRDVTVFMLLFLPFYLPLYASKHGGSMTTVLLRTAPVLHYLLHLVFEESEESRAESHIRMLSCQHLNPVGSQHGYFCFGFQFRKGLGRSIEAKLLYHWVNYIGYRRLESGYFRSKGRESAVRRSRPAQ